MKIEMPNRVKEIISILNQNGYSAYIVGGCVRDSLLGIEPHDWDITTNATPIDMKHIGEFLENITIIPTGEEFGTMTWMFDNEDDGYEVTTYRGENGYKDCRHPTEITFEDSLEKDLSRRDFTINSMAYNDDVGLVDLYGGRVDLLEKKQLRAVGNADKRFTEDSLRILRGIRFAIKYNLQIESKTEYAMIVDLPLIQNISKERIKEELVKILSYKVPYEFRHMIAYILDVSSDNVDCIEEDMDYKKKIAIILNSKQELYQVEEWLRKTKFSNKEIKTILNILKLYRFRQAGYSDYDIRCMINKYPLDDIKLYFENDDGMIYRINENTKKPCHISDLKLNGQDLIEIGIKGKQIGETLEYIMNYVLEYPEENNKDKLLKIAKNKYNGK